MRHPFTRDLTFYLIRHGESTSNAGDVIGGEQASLTERGVAQAKALSAYLMDYPLPASKLVCASHLPRAMQTAHLLADGLRVSKEDIVIDERLCEIRRGRSLLLHVAWGKTHLHSPTLRGGVRAARGFAMASSKPRDAREGVECEGH